MSNWTSRNLIGKWISGSQGSEGAKIYGQITMEFKHNGQLIYTIHGKDKDQIVLLTYLVDNGFIVTNQPSHPHEERTPFSFTLDGRLSLTYDGTLSYFVRM